MHIVKTVVGLVIAVVFLIFFLFVWGYFLNWWPFGGDDDDASFQGTKKKLNSIIKAQ